MSQETAYISLGSNLGDSVAIIRKTFDSLQALSDQPLVKSSLWRSKPVGCPPGSPFFINAAAALVTRKDETPFSLLDKLRQIEKLAGRRPKKMQNEPRPLDLDLIAFGERIANSAELMLPHPRAHLRGFVLQPLNEVAPDLILPGQSKPVRLLAMEPFPDESLLRLSL